MHTEQVSASSNRVWAGFFAVAIMLAMGFAAVAFQPASAWAAPVSAMGVGDDGTSGTASRATTYKIVYNLNDGTQPSGQIKVVEEGVSMKVSKLKVPTRKGYRFLGWYSDKALTTKATYVKGVKSAASRTVYAKWVRAYKIYFYLNNGTQAADQVLTVDKGSTLKTSKLKTPTRNGYTFVGWYKTSSLKTAATQISGSSTKSKRTVYAKWKKRPYTITYKLRGGKQAKGQVKTFTKTTATFKLKSPSRPLYKFAGWYTDKTWKTRVTQVVKGTKKDLVLYAKWKWGGADNVFFGQNDKSSNWYNLSYWSGKNIGGSGCGLVSYTMAIDILTGSTYTPYDMYYLRGGAKGSWRGTDLTGSSKTGQLEKTPLTHSQFSEKHFGVKQGTMYKLDFSTAAKKKASVAECIDKLKAGLEKGNVYLITRGGGKCFKNTENVWEYHGGHYVLLYRYDKKKDLFYIHDPSGNTSSVISKHRAVPYTMADMKKMIGFRAGYIGYLYKAK